MIIVKVGGKCDISHFSREYVLVKATHPALLRVCPCCLRSEDSAKTPCIEESETVVLVFLLMEYWSPKQGRVVCRLDFRRLPGPVFDGLWSPKIM